MDFNEEEKEVPIKSWIGTSKSQNPSVVDGNEPRLNEPNGLWVWYSKGEFKGIVIADRGIATTISQNTGKFIQRRSIKINDERSTVNITIWNDKVKQL